MIRHTVVFKLKHPRDSIEERDFLRAADILTAIPVVRNFLRLRQVNPRSPYDYCLSMEFDSRQDYLDYNEHPVHLEFVGSRWMPEVAAFMELDYEIMT
jgi:hypothetical protein